MAQNPTQDERNDIGQLLFDLFIYQVFELNQIHADPHPGNFLFQKSGKIGLIDFGCVKKTKTRIFKKNSWFV